MIFELKQWTCVPSKALLKVVKLGSVAKSNGLSFTPLPSPTHSALPSEMLFENVLSLGSLHYFEMLSPIFSWCSMVPGSATLQCSFFLEIVYHRLSKRCQSTPTQY